MGWGRQTGPGEKLSDYSLYVDDPPDAIISIIINIIINIINTGLLFLCQELILIFFKQQTITISWAKIIDIE